jgi:hypothetical protein
VIRGVGQRARNHNFATLLRFPRKLQVRVTELTATLQIVSCEIVDQQIVHVRSPVSRFDATAILTHAAKTRLARLIAIRPWSNATFNLDSTIPERGEA